MKNWFKKMVNRVSINGVDVVVGRNIVIRGNKVMVDGQTVDVNLTVGQQELDIRVLEGSIGMLDAGGSVECGEVTGNVDCGGSVNVSGSVGGKLDVGGSATVGGNVGGDVDTGGSATIGGSVAGAIDAGGSVRIGSK